MKVLVQPRVRHAASQIRLVCEHVGAGSKVQVRRLLLLFVGAHSASLASVRGVVVGFVSAAHGTFRMTFARMNDGTPSTRMRRTISSARSSGSGC